jgi:hypothetical protein
VKSRWRSLSKLWSGALSLELLIIVCGISWPQCWLWYLGLYTNQNGVPGRCLIWGDTKL